MFGRGTISSHNVLAGRHFVRHRQLRTNKNPIRRWNWDVSKRFAGIVYCPPEGGRSNDATDDGFWVNRLETQLHVQISPASGRCSSAPRCSNSTFLADLSARRRGQFPRSTTSTGTHRRRQAVFQKPSVFHGGSGQMETFLQMIRQVLSCMKIALGRILGSNFCDGDASKQPHSVPD